MKKNVGYLERFCIVLVVIILASTTLCAICTVYNWNTEDESFVSPDPTSDVVVVEAPIYLLGPGDTIEFTYPLSDDDEWVNVVERTRELRKRRLENELNRLKDERDEIQEALDRLKGGDLAALGNARDVLEKYKEK